MVSFDEDRIRVDEGRVEDSGRETARQTGGQGGRGQRTVYIAGIGYRYYTHTLTS